MARAGVRATFALATGLLAACSALIDVGGAQCRSDDQCTSAGLGSTCVRHVCVGETATATLPASEEPELVQENGACSRDDECAESAPHCFQERCVSEVVTDRFVCTKPEPEPEPESSKTVHYGFKVVEFVSRKPPQHITAKACKASDIECESPVAEFEDKAGSGLVEFDLPVGFLGFFDVKSDAMPALSYLSKPLRDSLIDRDLQVPSPSTAMLFATVAGVDFDFDKGVALVEAFECSGMPAGGVHFTESSGEALPFYFVNHIPNKDVDISVYDANNDVADGGFINLPPGFVTFSAHWGVDGPLLGEFNATVRSRTITFVDMYF